MRKRLWLLGVVLLLAVPLVLIVQDFARDVLLVEFLRILWVMRVLFESLPQVIVWSFLLLLVLLVAVKSLFIGPRSAQEVPDAVAEPQGRVQLLAKQIRHASESEYSAWNLARSLGKLIVEVLAYRQGTTTKEIKRRMRGGTLDTPLEIQTYLWTGLVFRSFTYTGFFSRLRWRLSASSEASSVAPSLESVVQFLEDQLED